MEATFSMGLVVCTVKEWEVCLGLINILEDDHVRQQCCMLKRDWVGLLQRVQLMNFEEGKEKKQKNKNWNDGCGRVG